MNKEKYKQMNQLDRIEFILLRKELTNTTRYTLSGLEFCIGIILITLLFGILETGFYRTTHIFATFYLIINIFLVFIGVMLVIDIISYFINLSNYEWINTHFQLNLKQEE